MLLTLTSGKEETTHPNLGSDLTHAPASFFRESARPMTQAILEHVNVTVGNTERTAAMLAHLFDWDIRWQGPAANGGHTIHVGSPTGYIAVYAAKTSDGTPLSHAKGLPLNHVGIEVANLDEVERRAKEIGLTPFNHDDYEPGRRFYLFDGDGIEWEIVSYSTA